MKSRFLGLLAVGLLGGSPAQAVTIGFEGVVATTGEQFPATPYTESGYQLTDPIGANGIFGAASGQNTNGSAVFGWCNGNNCGVPLEVITLTAVGGGAFNFTSIDAANLGFGEPLSDATQTLDLVGQLAGGGTVTDVVTIGDDWQTFSLTGLGNVTSVAIFGPQMVQDIAMDNLVVSAASVPEPATLSLLGLGLAGVGFMRRRRKG